MIDHVSVGVSSLEAAEGFYDEVLGTLGYDRLAKMDSLIAYGRGRIEFLAMLPFDGEGATRGNGTHLAFVAETSEAVDAFHAAALEQGGSCDGPPGPRDYPHRKVYASYVRDPFGNKLEALTDGFAVQGDGSAV